MPTRPIKTALASYGMSGQVFHAPFIAADPAFALVAAVERSKNMIATRYPGVHVVKSFEELLSIDEIELVVVNTPDVTHYDYTLSALEAGKNVVVEKPFVATLAQARELTALAKSKGLLLTVYQNRRWDGDFLTARAMVDSGVLGRVLEYNTAFERFRDPTPGASWKERANERVGLLYNLGSHSLDQALVLFGMPDALWATTDIVRDGGEVVDYFQIVMIYPRMRANLRACMRAREGGPHFALHGTQGSYSVYGVDPQEAALKDGAIPGVSGWGEVPQREWGILNTVAGRAAYPTLPGNYAMFYDNIRACMREGAEPQITHDQMMNLVELLEAAYQSAATGETFRFK